MGYVLLTATALLSPFALRFWLRFLGKRLKPLKVPHELADISTGGEADLVGMFLPRSARAVWNSFVLTVCTLGFGLPHFLVLWNFWRKPEIDPWLYVHYAWTLVYWLALLAFPALFITRHRQARALNAGAA